MEREEDTSEIIHFPSFDTNFTAKLESGQKLEYGQKMEKGYFFPFLGFMF